MSSSTKHLQNGNRVTIPTSFVFLASIVFTAGFSIFVDICVMRCLLGYSGDGAILGLSRANFRYALNAGLLSAAVSVTLTLIVFAALPSKNKRMVVWPAFIVPILCGIAFFFHIIPALAT